MTWIQIQHVTRIQIQHMTRLRILHVKRIDLVQGRTTMKGDGGEEVDLHSVPTKDVCVLRGGERHTGNTLWSSNDNMASDFSNPQSHAINDGSSVISNSLIDGVLDSSLRVTIYYN